METALAGKLPTIDRHARHARLPLQHGQERRESSMHGAHGAHGAREFAEFLEFASSELYTVAHAAAGRRRGAVLLCGPLGVERERAYRTLVLWARTLAARGFDVLRFDYRGNGESAGTFEDMNLPHWREDVDFCAARLAADAPGVPLVLQGVRFGALPAAELFATGIGDALLLWAPPASAEAMLRETLRRHVIAQFTERPARACETREQLIAALERGQHVNVDGYFLTPALWKTARGRTLCLPPEGEPRPWCALKAQVGAVAAPATAPPQSHATVDDGSFWNGNSTSPVLHGVGFFEASLRWLDAHVPARARGA